MSDCGSSPAASSASVGAVLPPRLLLPPAVVHPLAALPVHAPAILFRMKSAHCNYDCGLPVRFTELVHTAWDGSTATNAEVRGMQQGGGGWSALDV